MKFMNSIITLIGLSSSLAVAGPQDTFSTLNIREVKQSLAVYAKQQSGDGWFAYSVPAAPDTHSMCCFNHGEQSRCDLSEQGTGYGSSSNAPFTDYIHVFVEYQGQDIKRIMPVGDHCQVKAEGLTVEWLAHVDNQQSIEWLAAQAHADQDKHHRGSLYTLSLHDDPLAAETLYDMASEQAGQLAEQSVFWLGQRKSDGFPYIKQLFNELPVGKIRRKVNFALSQNENPKALELLKKIASHDQDKEQQADAIFWLSQADDVEDLPAFLLDLLNHSDDQGIKEKAIFSLSQIDSEAANEVLTQLVEEHDSADVREKALFWLAHNHPEQAAAVAMQLLQNSAQQNEQENAVFVLSQLPGNQGTQALLDIVKGPYTRSIKKKALFWLSQSDDEDTIKALEQLL